MNWIAPPEKDASNDALEKRLWAAADQLRANSGLTAQQYSAPVLGLIFLRFAEVRFDKRRAQLEKSDASSRRGSRIDDPAAYHADGILFLSEEACSLDTLNSSRQGRSSIKQPLPEQESQVQFTSNQRQSHNPA